MIEPLKALFDEIERMSEDRQREAVRVLTMFIDGRIRIEKFPDVTGPGDTPKPAPRR